MSKVEIKEQAIDIDDLIEQGRCLGYESCRKEVLEVIRLCNLSKMPEKNRRIYRKRCKCKTSPRNINVDTGGENEEDRDTEYNTTEFSGRLDDASD